MFCKYRGIVFVCAVVLAQVMMVSVAAGSPIVAGTGPAEGTTLATYTYFLSDPHVNIGSGTMPQEVFASSTAGPLMMIFEPVTGQVAHDLHITATFQVYASSLLSWHQILMVPDGDGGWEPSDDFDWLYFAGGTGSPTLFPTISPDPYLVSLTNNYDNDTLSFVWLPDLQENISITFEEYVHVGRTTQLQYSQFAIFAYPVVPTTTPEPATMSLLGLGLAALLARRKNGR